MEEGLKVILSADVTAFQEAFVRAANTTKQQVTAINNTLSSTGRSAESAALSFEKFVGQRMGAALKQFGTQGAAIRAVAAEWAVYSQAVGQAGQSGRGIDSTAAAVQKVAAAMGLLQGVNLPSTAPLVNGLEQAEAALKRFSVGTMTVREVNGAIVQLIKSKEGLSNTAAIDALITKLTALKDTARETAATGLTIDPQVNVADTLRDVERIKGVIGSQRFSFTLTADARPLNASVLSAASATRGAVDEIKSSLYLGELAFEEMTQKAQRSVISYVRAVSQLKTVPIDLRTTVQATDYSGVIKSIQDVKSKIAAASFEGLTFTKLPTLTLSADTTQFRQNLLQTKAVSEETWQAIRQNFVGVDKAIQDAANNSRASISQIIQQYNALRAATPNATNISIGVAKTDFKPLITAARKAGEDIKWELGKAFVTPMPTNQLNAATSALKKQFASTTAVGMQFNQLLREMPNFAIDARIGVMSLSNNLPYFVDAITDARKQGQGFGGILKTLGGAMFSVSGIAILAVTAFTAFAGRMSSTKDKAKGVTDELAKAREAAENFVESLDLISKARLKGEMNAQKELVSLNLLYAATQNQNLAYSDRKKAVDELQRQYPAYFKNLSDETIMAGSAKSAYDDLTAAILRKAKAASAEKELETLSSDERRIRNERQLAAQSFFDATQTFNKAKEAYLKASKSEDPQVITYMTRMQAAERKMNEEKERAIGLGVKLTDVLSNQADLTKEIQGYGIDAILPEIKTPEIKPKANTEDAEDALKKLESYVKGLQLDAQADINATPVVKEPTNWLEQWRESLKQQFEKQIDTSVTLNFTAEQVKANALTSEVDDVFTTMMEKYRDADVKFPTIDLEQFIKEGGAEKLKEYLQTGLDSATEFRDSMKKIMGDAAVDSIAGFFEGVGEAMTGGNLGKAFENVLGVLGGALQEMGKKLIMSSAIIENFKKALNGLMGPGGTQFGFAVGAAMIAIGAAMKSAQLPKFADGGIVFGPTVGLMGEYAGASSNPEVIAPLSKLKDMLRGAGGATSVNVNGSWEVAGDKLRLVLARSNRKSGRYI